jgi:SAM-dependent methyltransferase
VTAPAARFWDRRARENPFFFIDDRLDYNDPDLDRFWERGEEALEGLLSLLGARLRPTDTVLEIGCGVGRMTRPLAAQVERVLALDISSQMLARARGLSPGLENVSWVLGDGETLSGIEPGSVDACLSWVVFQHIPDPEITLGYIDEIGRVLKHGGWAAIQVSNDPAAHHWPRRARVWSGIRGLLGRSPRGRANRAWLGSAVDLEELTQRAAAAGAPVAETYGEGTQYCLVLLRTPADRAGGPPP